MLFFTVTVDGVSPGVPKTFGYGELAQEGKQVKGPLKKGSVSLLNKRIRSVKANPEASDTPAFFLEFSASKLLGNFQGRCPNPPFGEDGKCPTCGGDGFHRHIRGEFPVPTAHERNSYLLVGPVGPITIKTNNGNWVLDPQELTLTREDVLITAWDEAHCEPAWID